MKLTLDLTSELHSKLKKRAKKNKRTLHQETCYIVERWFAEDVELSLSISKKLGLDFDEKNAVDFFLQERGSAARHEQKESKQLRPRTK